MIRVNGMIKNYKNGTIVVTIPVSAFRRKGTYYKKPYNLMLLFKKNFTLSRHGTRYKLPILGNPQEIIYILKTPSKKWRRKNVEKLITFITVWRLTN